MQNYDKDNNANLFKLSHLNFNGRVLVWLFMMLVLIA